MPCRKQHCCALVTAYCYTLGQLGLSSTHFGWQSPGQGDSRVREKHNRFCAVSLGYTGRGLKLDGIMLAARLG